MKIGDRVEVLDRGLAMLRRLAPPGAKPNHHGTVAAIWDDGTVLVEFPIGDDDPREHSQTAPYPPKMVRLRNPKEFENPDKSVVGEGVQ